MVVSVIFLDAIYTFSERLIRALHSVGLALRHCRKLELLFDFQRFPARDLSTAK